MKILITGYYGAGNFGDDIMLEAFCKRMKSENPEIEISILKMFDRELNIDLDSSIKVINYYKLKRKLNTAIFMMLMMKYDMFVWVGGTCFTDEDGNGLYWLMKRAKQLRKKFGYIGVGIGNLTKKERIDMTEYLLNNCEFISLRDKRSYDYVKKVRMNTKNVYLTEDLAYLFVDKHERKENKEICKKIVVSWRNLVNYRTEEEEQVLMNNLINYLKKLSEETVKIEILILPLDDRKDCEKNQIIYQKLLGSENKYTTIKYLENISPVEKIEKILECDLNICGRLHGIFVSELNNINTVALSYSIKIDEFLKSINKECDCISIDNLTVESLENIEKNNSRMISNNIIKEKIVSSNNNIKYFIDYLNTI
ncbi:polysaccharide pyruvyl transferase family protein [Clostridium disporicum]|uniref:Polysaccharide pyruvyl transferase CsaB n=1 Tax=Clostridium disporicum TaxID=84024 RepID=A0A174FCT7_9CLOT|nr:polysaccharide pyruvyl transferase family protein [Clostridium disporicum]CUO46160.1 polysaccharide pyruvyl transferase CsaB [Clostridium disporicum]